MAPFVSTQHKLVVGFSKAVVHAPLTYPPSPPCVLLLPSCSSASSSIGIVAGQYITPHSITPPSQICTAAAACRKPRPWWWAFCLRCWR